MRLTGYNATWLVNVTPTTAADRQTSPSAVLAAFMARHQVVMPLALGVSGGSDSLALMHLVAEWARHARLPLSGIHVLTVNHGLRREAGREAAFVAREARQIGLSHTTLHWRESRSGPRLQERARAARYRLMASWCRARGIPALMTAHTAGDQLETVGLRLVKGSGSAGLGGMDEARPLATGVTLLRPLLGVTRDELQTQLSARGRQWISDPSNDNTSFARIQMRRVLADEAVQTPLRRIRAAGGEARAALDGATDDLMRDAVLPHGAGWAEIDARLFCAAPQAVRLHALKRLCRFYGGKEHAPKAEALVRLDARLLAADFRAVTLGGALLTQKGDCWLMGREARNLPVLALAAGERAVWDRRVEIFSAAAPLRVEALGSKRLKALAPALRRALREIVPAVFQPSHPVIVGPEGQETLAWIAPAGAHGAEIGALLPSPFTGVPAPLARN